MPTQASRNAPISRPVVTGHGVSRYVDRPEAVRAVGLARKRWGLRFAVVVVRLLRAETAAIERETRRQLAGR